MTVMSDADDFTDYFIIRKTDVTGFQFHSSIIFKLFSQNFIGICDMLNAYVILLTDNLLK